jgi:hypothetical protein
VALQADSGRGEMVRTVRAALDQRGRANPHWNGNHWAFNQAQDYIWRAERTIRQHGRRPTKLDLDTK